LSNLLIDGDSFYFKLEDWDDAEIEKWKNTRYKEMVALKYPDLDWTLYDTFNKRITPLEFLASSFINEYPIQKSHLSPYLLSIQLQIDTNF
jgi:hypothetical protein